MDYNCLMIDIQRNILAFTLVILSTLIIEVIAYANFSVGSLLFLPLGATLYCYLWMGYRTIPAIVVANTIIGYFLWDNWFGNGMDGFIGHVVVGSLAPMVAILIVQVLHLNRASFENKIDYGPCLLLIILTALLNTLAKFFTFMDTLKEGIDPIIFLGTFFTGDVLGCTVFLLIAHKLLTPTLHKYKLVYRQSKVMQPFH